MADIDDIDFVVASATISWLEALNISDEYLFAMTKVTWLAMSIVKLHYLHQLQNWTFW